MLEFKELSPWKLLSDSSFSTNVVSLSEGTAHLFDRT